MSPELQFFEDGHRYVMGGHALPSVTTVLARAQNFEGIPKKVLAHKAEIGRAVHTAIRYLHEGDLDLASVDPAIPAYLDGYRWFLAESGFEPGGWEVPMGSNLYGYAGTPDLWGKLNGHFVVPDIKCVAKPSGITALQTAAYGQLVEEHTQRKVVRRFTLQLRADGKYRLIEHEERSDFSIFLAYLQTYNWEKLHA